jgi:hypothetical protein
MLFARREPPDCPNHLRNSPAPCSCLSSETARPGISPAKNEPVSSGSRARCAHRSPLLKAFAAINRAPLGGLERYGCFFPALRANRLGFHPVCGSGIGTVARRALCFARLAPLGLVFEPLVGEKHLLAGGENELSPTFPTLQDLIVIFHCAAPGACWVRIGSGTASVSRGRDSLRTLAVPKCRLARGCSEGPKYCGRLILLTPLLFPEALTREGFLGPTLFTGLHVVAVLLDLLDDVLRLNLALESPEGILQGFALLNYDFCHAYFTPVPLLIVPLNS